MVQNAGWLEGAVNVTHTPPEAETSGETHRSQVEIRVTYLENVRFDRIKDAFQHWPILINQKWGAG